MESNKTEVLSFDEWLKEKVQPASNFLRRETYEAGQQSKQDEVDELRERIVEALKLLNLACHESWGYCVDEAINILKGEETK